MKEISDGISVSMGNLVSREAWATIEHGKEGDLQIRDREEEVVVELKNFDATMENGKRWD